MSEIKTEAEKILADIKTETAKLESEEAPQLAVVKAAKWWIVAAFAVGCVFEFGLHRLIHPA